MVFPASLHTTPTEMMHRLALPYGIWTCADGREVLFNREYQPIWHRRGVGDWAEQANPAEWVRWQSQHWFYGDHNDPTRNKKTLRMCLRILAAFREGHLLNIKWSDGGKS